jgi:hypothetical protein
MTREVLKQALEALENINNWLPTIGQKGLRDYEADAITAIKAALAQQDAEAHLQAVADFGQLQEPQLTPSGIHKIGCVNHDCQHCKEMQDWEYETRKLHTSPPKRQPLTDAQIWQLVNDCSFNRDLHADKFARAIEVAHSIGGDQ